MQQHIEDQEEIHQQSGKTRLASPHGFHRRSMAERLISLLAGRVNGKLYISKNKLPNEESSLAEIIFLLCLTNVVATSGLTLENVEIETQETHTVERPET